MSEILTDAPYLNEMGRILQEKVERGTIGVRLFVQKSLDISADDVARDFREMELARLGKPYYTALRV